jgi:adenosylhomocysteine nucleosidase
LPFAPQIEFTMTRTAIIAALPGELKPLVRGWQHERRNGVDLWRSHDADHPWAAACAGAGQDAATRAFAEIERDGPIHHVISTGWAGGLHRVIQAGHAYSVCGVIDSRTGEMTPTAEWKDDLWLVTSPRVADREEKLRLAATYDAALVDMEAAAIARLAVMRNIPFYCWKGVSDAIDDRLPDFNLFIDDQGQFHTARLALFALFRPKLWPALWAKIAAGLPNILRSRF